ncbi:MAG: hydrogenase maturation nickel metallochaperone HypA [Alphaproteobacteria bacterium]|nr:hydrogenase maturation nickel metallochaperone HypA [Alphaproteobacteria bacterium]MCB9696923.1 hydrogenase maturation nickel metallochaperone HypA [Alphaproteobacteria bacterium]
MHELSITRNIVSIVAGEAAGRPVKRVHLTIGRLSGVDVAAIAFCFPLVAEGTAVAGAELVVHRVEGRGRCEGCRKELPLDELVGVCPCERREPMAITAGEELLVRSMEL